MSQNKLIGVFIGILTASSYVNLYLSLPVVLLLVLLMSKPLVAKSSRTAYVSLGMLTLFFTSVVINKRSDDLLIIAPHIFLIISLAIGLCLKIRGDVIEGFENVMVIALILDLSVNIITLFMLQDPFGRSLDIRSDGLIRMNGISGHPFVSVAISVLGGVIGLDKRNKNLIILVIANMLINQTLRSYISLILIPLAYLILIGEGRKFVKYALFTISFSISIWVATIVSDNPANQMRTLAWTNSLGIILEHPTLGMSGFERVDFLSEGVSENNLMKNGISENFYLDIAMHFGIPLALLLFVFFAWISWRVLKERNINRQENKLSLIFLIMMTDSFYGNFMVTSLLSIYLMLCLMDKNVKLFNRVSKTPRIICDKNISYIIPSND